jgi:hypothetical protein
MLDNQDDHPHPDNQYFNHDALLDWKSLSQKVYYFSNNFLVGYIYRMENTYSQSISYTLPNIIFLYFSISFILFILFILFYFQI